MITGPAQEPVKTYRELEGLNYSSIKTFAQDGPGIFFKEFFLKERKEKESDAIKIGTLVDDIIIDHEGDFSLFHQNFDQKYSRYGGVRTSAQAFDLADCLYKEVVESMVKGVVTIPFEDAFKNAFDQVQKMDKYKGKTWEKGLEDFNKIAKDYYELKISSIGKMVIDEKIMSMAEDIARKAWNDDNVGPILRGEDMVTLRKLVIEFEYLGIKCKSELDLVRIDHENLTIQPIDVKNTYDNEGFDYLYKKMRYDIQQALYTIGVTEWAKQEGFGDYTVLPFQFIVLDTSINRRKPLIYQLDNKDFLAGLKGYKSGGRSYDGIIKLITDINWHTENDVWDISREAYENKGVVKLEVIYE